RKETPQQKPAGHAAASREGRTSLRHAKNEDGGDALSNEASSEGCHRDGSARACLQPHPRDEHYGHSAADGGDQGIVKVRKNSSRRPFVHFRPPTGKRFYTWGNSGIEPYSGSGNQLSRNRRGLTSWSLAIMESCNGTLCGTRRIAEADSDLHC